MLLEQEIVYLLLGSNLGDKRLKLGEAIEAIAASIGPIVTQSSWYETAAWGLEDQPDFLNVALAVSTGYTPHQVLEKALDIEEKLGRVRKEKWGARHIDIDILLFGEIIVDDGDHLQIPHPLMLNRKFVMMPLAEIAGDVIHPVAGKTIRHLLSLLQDSSDVFKIV